MRGSFRWFGRPMPGKMLIICRLGPRIAKAAFGAQEVLGDGNCDGVVTRRLIR